MARPRRHSWQVLSIAPEVVDRYNQKHHASLHAMLAKQAEAAANVEGKGAVAAAAAGEAEATTCASAVADASGPGREMVEGEEAVAAADTIE